MERTSQQPTAQRTEHGFSRRSLLKGFVAGGAALLARSLEQPAAAAAASQNLLTAPGCQFILGFKSLHDLDPADIGDCVDNQSFTANGDAIQHTTRGTMVWRKADNWTAFTNGNRTWINGPQGLQDRLNTKRFSWEANPEKLPLADEELPATHIMPDNPFARGYEQRYWLSCEVAAVNMAMSYYGLQTSEDRLLDILGRNDNPNLGFRGNVNSEVIGSVDDYGAHAPAIKKLVENYPKPGAFEGILLSGLDDVKRALAKNQLVIAWVPSRLDPVNPAGITTLQFGPDKVNLIPNEHAVLVVGYDANGIFLDDPDKYPPKRLVPQGQTAHVTNEAFAAGMSYFQFPALAIKPNF